MVTTTRDIKQYLERMPYTLHVGNVPGGRTEFVSIQAAIDYADSQGGDWTILIYPGTYDEGDITPSGGANITLKGMGEDRVVIAPTAAPATAVIVSAWTLALQDLIVTAPDATKPALVVQGNICTANHCDFNGVGAGDSIDISVGTLNLIEGCNVNCDIELHMNNITLNAYNSYITGGINTAAEALAHVIKLIQCDLADSNIVSTATGGTTLDMAGCTSVGTVSHAGNGAFVITNSEVATVTTSSTGPISVVGGYLGACGGATASVTWRTGPNRYEVITGMDIQHALTAGAGGEIVIHNGDHYAPNPAAPGAALTVAADTLVRGQGKNTIIHGGAASANITNPMLLNGNNITIKDMKLILDAGCGTVGARPNVVYATGRTLIWLENLWIVGDTSVADDGSDARQCGVYFNGVGDSKIVDCRIEDNDRHGINLETNSNDNTVTGNTCQGNTSYGIFLSGSHDNTVTGNICHGNASHAINLQSAERNTITGNTCRNNTTGVGIRLNTSHKNTVVGNTLRANMDGIQVINSDNNTITGNNCILTPGYGIQLNTANNNTIAGNTCQGNTRHGIQIRNSTNNTVTGNTCADNNSGGNTYSGICIESCNQNTVTGNQCDANGLHGIYIYRSSYCTVSGNGCHNQNTGDGINVTGDATTDADENTLTGNVCRGNGSDGIEIAGGANADRNIVLGNQLLGNTGNPLLDNGANTQVAHNVQV